MLRSILHCDMNNFYASVECMLDPALKKYPIAVCGSVEERHGIVLAKNYKAKAFDVKTGDAVWQAKQKCKDLVVVPPHYEEYIKYSKLARSVYERYTDQVESYGMDECWLDISGTESLFGSPEKVANEIRETMKFELGLTISVGVSFNKIFAKLGSDMKKPDAVTVIPKDTFKEKIWGLPAADLLGVGRATQRVLDSYCIRTIGDLANTDPEFLRRRLGKNGVVLWNYANGNDLSLVAKKDFVSPIKSVGHGITTVADLEKPEQVWPVFLELTQDIGHKLRVHGLSAEGVAIHIRDNTLNTRQWQTKIALPTVLHQILDMAVDDDYLRNNPSNNVLKELKQSHCFQTEKRRALTRPEQELFLSYLKNTPSASLWYPIFAVLVGTGLRVGEATGLRWCDIDLDEGIINVNHTLVYYDHRTDGSKRGCYFNINTTKTPAGKRQVPMLDFVKEAFLMEKERQELLDIHCEAVVDGYTDFIFLNRFGQPQHQATLNKAIRRIIRDCNDEQLLKDENAKVLLPHFSCHSLRHTFTTRMCEAGVNVKVIQDTLGHKDISTTLNIYTDVTKELRRSEFEGLDSYFKNEYNKANEVL